MNEWTTKHISVPLLRGSKDWAEMRKWRWFIIQYLFVIVFTCVIWKILDMISLACKPHHQCLHSDSGKLMKFRLWFYKNIKQLGVYSSEGWMRDPDQVLQSHIWITLNLSGFSSWQMIVLAKVVRMKVKKTKQKQPEADTRVQTPEELLIYWLSQNILIHTVSLNTMRLDAVTWSCATHWNPTSCCTTHIVWSDQDGRRTPQKLWIFMTHLYKVNILVNLCAIIFSAITCNHYSLTCRVYLFVILVFYFNLLIFLTLYCKQRQHEVSLNWGTNVSDNSPAYYTHSNKDTN